MPHANPTFDVQPARAAVSIVSHGHGALVTALLADLAAHCGGSISAILTLNVPEPFAPDPALPFPVRLVRNVAPKGFRANHNAAFKQCHEACFCVLNPDIRLVANPFLRLIAELEQPGVGLAAPRIVDPAGHTEDSARGYDVRVGPTVSAVRAARRESRRSLRHLRWHVASMLRYFMTRRAQC